MFLHCTHVLLFCTLYSPVHMNFTLHCTLYSSVHCTHLYTCTVWLPGPELRQITLVLGLSPGTVLAVHPPSSLSSLSLSLSLSPSVLAVHPPGDQVRGVRHTPHPHAGVGSKQPVSNIVTVEAHTFIIIIIIIIIIRSSPNPPALLPDNTKSVALNRP